MPLEASLQVDIVASTFIPQLWLLNHVVGGILGMIPSDIFPCIISSSLSVGENYK